jgi:DNA-binding SARP family transcriptional activator
LDQQRSPEDKDKEEEEGERETIQTLFSSDANVARALADLRFVLCALRKSLISAGREKRELGGSGS